MIFGNGWGPKFSRHVFQLRKNPKENPTGDRTRVNPSGPVVIILATGSGVDGFFQSVKILSMTSFGREVKRWSRVVDLRHVKELQAEIRASEPNSSSM